MRLRDKACNGLQTQNVVICMASQRHVCLFFFSLPGYHMQMVELFAEYDPMGLLPFLRASERYPLEEVNSVGVDVLDDPHADHIVFQYKHVLSIYHILSMSCSISQHPLYHLLYVFLHKFIIQALAVCQRKGLRADLSGLLWRAVDCFDVWREVRKLPTCLAVLAECQTH